MTEITVADGSRFRVHGDAHDIERRILDAARGSIMELTWITDAESGEQIGINPEHVILLRALRA